MKARTKPMEINFVKWQGNNLREVEDFLGCKPVNNLGWNYSLIGGVLKIHNSGGIQKVDDGDFIIENFQGEFSACKPDVFSRTYEVI